MTLFLSDLVNEFSARMFFDFEGYGEKLLTLSVANPRAAGDVIPTVVEFHDEMVSPSAVVLEVEQEFYLTAVEVCNTLNAGTRRYKHFVQETPEGKLQVCVAVDYVARAPRADRCYDLLMDFAHHVYDVKAYIMGEE